MSYMLGGEGNWYFLDRFNTLWRLAPTELRNGLPLSIIPVRRDLTAEQQDMLISNIHRPEHIEMWARSLGA